MKSPNLTRDERSLMDYAMSCGLTAVHIKIGKKHRKLYAGTRLVFTYSHGAGGLSNGDGGVNRAEAAVRRHCKKQGAT